MILNLSPALIVIVGCLSSAFEANLSPIVIICSPAPLAAALRQLSSLSVTTAPAAPRADERRTPLSKLAK